MMEIGICSFADVGQDPVTHQYITPDQRLRNLLKKIELADQAGLNVMALGEHHRPDYAVSNTEVVLAAAAERTKNIRLSSGVSVWSSDQLISGCTCLIYMNSLCRTSENE